jgi:hypothetical protein
MSHPFHTWTLPAALHVLRLAEAEVGALADAVKPPALPTFSLIFFRKSWGVISPDSIW